MHRGKLRKRGDHLDAEISEAGCVPDFAGPFGNQRDGAMKVRVGSIILLIIFVALAAIIIWVADYTAVGGRRATALTF